MNMKTHPIRLSETDHRRLRDLLAALSHDPRSVRLTVRLRDELLRAVIEPTRPPDAAGLDCRVELLDLDTRETEAYTLTLPERADIALGRLSVLTPLGTAILGYAVGDEFEWEMPGGWRRLRVTRVTPDVAVAPVASFS